MPYKYTNTLLTQYNIIFQFNRNMRSLIMTILVPFIFSLLLSVSTANVPQNATFRFVNEGFFDEYIDIEYGATYRSSSEPKLFASPFVVCFYNTTPGVYTLALRMGGSFHRRTTLLWVWEANRGKPVGENAVFALRNDGNLVLTHADGRLVWQTNTANKGIALESQTTFVHNNQILKPCFPLILLATQI